jgi:hypothetical protein
MELHLYDFDGTLFRAPDRPSWWGDSTWFAKAISLSPPCVPAKPGSEWWIGSSVSNAKASISNSKVWAILCTGRQLGSGLRFRVPELLKQKGLNFDEVYLNPGGDTKSYKVKVIQQILRKFPDIHTVQIWEDNNLAYFCKAVEGMGRTCIPHPVKVRAMEPMCSQEEIELLEAEGWGRRKAMAERVAYRYLERLAKGPADAGLNYLSAQLTPMARQKLLRAFPAIHSDIRADHMTIWYDPPDRVLDTLTPLLGKTTQLKVIGYAEDERGQVVRVATRLPTKGRNPHVTLSVAPGTKAVYSNTLLSRGFKKVTGPSLDAILTIQQ